VAALKEELYNECNALYRVHSNQQEEMIRALKDILNPSLLDFVSYGCGFGIFEMALIEEWIGKPIVFHGIDTNADALKKLGDRLKKIQEKSESSLGYGLQKKDMIEALGDRKSAPLGISIHSLYRVTQAELEKYLLATVAAHELNSIFIDPFTPFWKFFKAAQVGNGSLPIFADDVIATLERLGIEFSLKKLFCEVRIPLDAQDVLQKILAFISFDDEPLSMSQSALLSAYEELEATLENDQQPKGMAA
jgi:hypothetical protein